MADTVHPPIHPARQGDRRSSAFRMNMQASYDLEVTREQIQSDLDHIKPRKSA